MKGQIVESLVKITGLDSNEIHIETPENEEFGDYATNVALNLKSHNSKLKTKTQSLKLAENANPRQIAEKIAEELKQDKELQEVVDKIEVAGAGFINFWLKKDMLINNLIQIDKDKENYGKSDLGKGKTVIIEYSSPNIAKPFTVGHLRSTIIGDAIANLLETVGFKVLRDNHSGDWGTQFGKQIYAIKTWGNEAEIEKSENSVKELVALYVKFHQEAEKDQSLNDKGREWFKKLEEGDAEARRLWKKCVDWSWREFDRIYKILGVSFSKEFENGRGLGESFFENKMPVVIKELNDKSLLKEGEEGAKLVFFENDKYPPAMILKKDGTTLYHTRDLATDKYRKDNFSPDLIINEVGADQILYFQQLFEIERLLGWFKKGQRVHIYHGFIRFKEGKMSTRKGNVVWLEEVLDQAVQKAKSLSSNKGKMGLERPLVLHPEVSDKEGFGKPKAREEYELEQDQVVREVGIGALKYYDLKRDPKTEIVFDWDEILNMDGNSGPYIQYTYARTQSVSRKAGMTNDKLPMANDDKSNLAFSIGQLALNPEELSLLRTFVRFSDVISMSAKNYSPNLLCNYLYDLASKFNLFYQKHDILEQRTKNKGQSEFRLALTAATGQILKNGLNLLGIQTPERM